ncbi:MAG TPA: hypothetical protein VEC60_20030, partial [Reyranella sp.]|nr:hypothetical protein [Reyranella sp.]
MGAFTQRSSAYTPPFDGSKPGPTLVGGAAVQTAQTASSNARPWKIELRRHPIFHRGHAILALVDPNGKTVAELNGMPKSRNADTERPDKVMTISGDGSRLVVTTDIQFGDGAEPVEVVAAGSREDIAARWQRGLRAAQEITAKNYDYK